MRDIHPSKEKSKADPRAVWCLTATLLVSVAGLIYELVAATASSYLLGDSIKQFSFVTGIFLASMGAGAWLSRFVRDPLMGFIGVQTTLAIVGALLAPLAFVAFGYKLDPGIPIYLGLIMIGALSGMEIPLLTRVLEDMLDEGFHLENVLSADYIGALVAAIAFPILLVPNLGLVNAGIAFGILNFCVACASAWVFRNDFEQHQRKIMTYRLSLAALMLLTITLVSPGAVARADAALFQDRIIFSEQTPFQEIVVTQERGRTRLLLDRAIQFDTRDEARYHEMLVHPAMARAASHQNIVIFGGGDGLAAREILKYPDVGTVTLVDIDPRLPELFRDIPSLSKLNSGALKDPRIKVISKDAWVFLSDDTGDLYDVAILDLPDPKNLSLARLYSVEFYRMLRGRMSANGIVSVQSGSPIFTPDAFWSIGNAVREGFARNAGPQPVYDSAHISVPSFGEWGFHYASLGAVGQGMLALPKTVEHIDHASWIAAQTFPPSSAHRDVEANRLQTMPLVRFYIEGWEDWYK